MQRHRPSVHLEKSTTVYVCMHAAEEGAGGGDPYVHGGHRPSIGWAAGKMIKWALTANRSDSLEEKKKKNEGWVDGRHLD